MANKFTKFLGSVVDGIFGSRGDMSDYQHAARLFTDDYMKLAPKVKFLYHVVFNINQQAIKSPDGIFNKALPQIECGMLVKDVKLPGVQINTEVKKQYGKSTTFQTGVQYQPVNITFHDDNRGLTAALWRQYFQTYYNDSLFPTAIAKQKLYNNPEESYARMGYSSNVAARFFRDISIYQLSQHKFHEFKLINPIVASWDPPSMSAGDSQPAENMMQVIYEGIQYGYGSISVDNPAGFAQVHYDRSPSPLQSGGSGGLFGANGVIAGGLDIFGDVASGEAFANPFALLGTAIKAKNVIDKADRLNSESVKQEIAGITQRAIFNTTQDIMDAKGADKVDANKNTQAAEKKDAPGVIPTAGIDQRQIDTTGALITQQDGE